ncbi:MAG: 50S ribosomal protein L21e [Candidatus Bathyarchaeia archaeon]
MKRSKGFRSATRTLLRKNPREKGKLGTTKILQKFEPGDKVVVEIDSAIHKGMPHRRYHGKIGVIQSSRGRSYIVVVRQGEAAKKIIVRPEHLKMYAG